MDIISYKDTMELLKQGVPKEAQEKIMALREAAIELKEENLELRERLNKLEAESKLQKSLQFRDGAYWHEGDPHPFCHVCYDKDQKMIRLHDAKPSGVPWWCPVCKGYAGTRFGPAPSHIHVVPRRIDRTVGL